MPDLELVIRCISTVLAAAFKILLTAVYYQINLPISCPWLVDRTDSKSNGTGFLDICRMPCTTLDMGFLRPYKPNICTGKWIWLKKKQQSSFRGTCMCTRVPTHVPIILYHIYCADMTPTFLPFY